MPDEKNLRRNRRGRRRRLLRDPRAGDGPGLFPAISRSGRPITPVEAEEDLSLQQPLNLRSRLLLICPHPTRESQAYRVYRVQEKYPGSVFALRTITRSLETRARRYFVSTRRVSCNGRRLGRYTPQGAGLGRRMCLGEKNVFCTRQRGRVVVGRAVRSGIVPSVT